MDGARRLITRSAGAAIWAVAGGLALLAAAQVLAHDAVTPLTVAAAYTVWVYLPAYLVASAAACFRRYALAGVALVAVAFHALSVTASIGAAEAIPDDAWAAPRLRVLSANVYDKNPDRDRLARELLDADADVVLLQEITPAWARTLHRNGFGVRYPYSVVEAMNGSGGQAVYSRLPLHDVEVVSVARWPTITAALDVGSTRVHLANVHVVGPLHGRPIHERSAGGILRVARSLGRPRIVAGDFNATPYNRSMQRLADLGLDDAHERRGRGLAVTWPNGDELAPPIRIDHVLVDDELTVLRVAELRGHGSDHAPVLVDLAVG
ncbi:MAG: endonuclease [Acidimicrobiia bacterium]|nr:MAG: endonuclease [Acidimicrobiia bacterium]